MRTGLGKNSDHLWMHYIHKQLQCMSVVMYSPLIGLFPPIIDAEIVHLQPSKNTCVHPVFAVTNVLLLYIHVYVVLYFVTSA